jgi:uncharacterized protein
MALPNVLRFFNLYGEGESFLGQVEEVTIPKLVIKTEAYRGGPMLGEVDQDMGLDKMEMESTFGGPMRSVLRQFGVTTHDGAMLRYVGSYKSEDSQSVNAYEVVVRGRHTEMDFGGQKAGDKSPFKVKTSCSYYKLSINGVTEIEIDMVGMVFIVGGVDRLAEHRRALGIG